MGWCENNSHCIYVTLLTNYQKTFSLSNRLYLEQTCSPLSPAQRIIAETRQDWSDKQHLWLTCLITHQNSWTVYKGTSQWKTQTRGLLSHWDIYSNGLSFPSFFFLFNSAFILVFVATWLTGSQVATEDYIHTFVQLLNINSKKI